MAFLEYRPIKTLYKYCSPDGFYGIVRSKRLWFTDLYAANDPREIKLGYEHLDEALGSLLQGEYSGERGIALSRLRDDIARQCNTSRAYCCCLSMAADSLPMWREYGTDYGGVAVGFRPTAMFDVPARIQLVRYVDETTPDDFRRVAQDVAIQLEDIENPDEVYEHEIEKWTAAASNAWSAITALKHNTWSHEQEVRVVHKQQAAPQPKGTDPVFSMTGLLPNGDPVMWREPLKRMVGQHEVSYLDFAFGRFRNDAFDPSGAIERVVLGPRCPLAIEQVDSDMRDLGYRSFEVVRSTCEIR